MSESAHRRQDVAVELGEQLIPDTRLGRSGREQPRSEFVASPTPHRRDLAIGQLIDEEINRAVADLSHLLPR
jgi:hypothetical protein